jgi:predicted unusual protein kinase regulating ubiquinone biosynthesis (AarF/ABC1/UbiB family)
MLKKALTFSIIAGSSFGFYKFKTDNSISSVYNLANAGIKIIYIYKYTDYDEHIKNMKASAYLRDALKKNGGIYLKLGQLIASLDVIVPDEYR